MKDQYGNPIPDDLVLLEANDVTLAEADTIEKLDWYCVGNKNGIFVSDSKLTEIIGEHDFVSPYDIYRDPEFFFVDGVLKRWNDEDGFYHV